MTTPVTTVPRILTPDQRPRVFISSTLAELAPERAAARRAVESLRLIPVMFELGARPHPARSLYRAYLAQSHVFVGLYFQRYGWVAPGEPVSGLEDEYLLSVGLPRLVYLRAPAPEREPRLEGLIDRIRADDTVSYRAFADPQELEALLREDLAVLLSERFLLGSDRLDDEEPERAADADVPVDATRGTPPAAVRLRTAPLPTPLTGLIGRDDEVGAVRSRLERARLVTVVGPGGIGKTRLAVEVARRLADADPVLTVAFVPLDTVEDPDRVLPAIAAALGIGLDGGLDVLDALGAALRRRDVLLVLDNLEQVVACGPALVALLERAPSVRVLATSRAPLRVRGEQQVALGPLALPEPGGAAAASPAVALFLERATAVRPDLTLDDPEDLAAVAELCRRLDGVPLALELAAARSRLLAPPALLDRLGSALDVGVAPEDLPERQRTLRDTVAWSERLLPADQRDLLRDLSVFRAPWTLADAEAVAAGPGTDVLEDVAGLVEHSLVHPSASARGEPRFRLYSAVRTYAAERADPARASAVEDRYTARMASLAHDLDRGIRSPNHARWQEEFRMVWPDLRAAWELALARERGDLMASFARGWIPLWLDGRAREAVDLMRRTLDLADRRRPSGHGDVVLSAAGLAFNTDDEPRARTLLDLLGTSVPLPEEPVAVGSISLYRGYLAATDGDLDAAGRWLSDAAEQLGECDVEGRWVAAFAHSGLGSLAALRGDLETAIGEHETSGRIGRECGNVAAEMQAAVFLAAIRLARGEVGDACALLRPVPAVMRAMPFYEGSAYAVEVAGAVGLARGDAPAAARALGLARGLRDVIGARVWTLLQPVSEQIDAAVRSALDPSAFGAAFDEGRSADPLGAAEVVARLCRPVSTA